VRAEPRGQELLQNVTMSTVNASIDVTVRPKSDLITHQTTTLSSELLTVFRGLLFNLDLLSKAFTPLTTHDASPKIPGPSRESRTG
jgi:hypothetical protein